MATIKTIFIIVQIYIDVERCNNNIFIILQKAPKTVFVDKTNCKIACL